MGLAEEIVRTAVLFGSGITLLLGVEQLSGRSVRSRSNYLLFAVSIFVAIILYNHAELSAGPPAHPWRAFLYVTSVYVIGPLNYLYYRSLIYPDLRIGREQAFHFLPAVVALSIELYLQTRPEPVKAAALHDVFTSVRFHPLLAFLFVGGFSFYLYQLFLLRQCLLLWNEPDIHRGLRLVVALETVNVLTPVPVLVWMFTRMSGLILLAGMMTTTVLITIFLTNNRFPTLFLQIQEALIRKKYGRSFLKGVDIDGIGRRLEALMIGECAYRDDDLTLSSLARRVGLTPHQLSQYLNEKIKTGFSGYINAFRVGEAKRLLVDDPSMSVISICFRVGFNSKSSFNSVFKQSTGMTPTEYRLRHGE